MGYPMIGKTISHYRIIEKLGEGGMGVVYKAQDLKLDRPVAIKFLPHHLSTDENAKRRFVNEAKAASALEHPNICTIHDIDETEDGQIFMAMAYYEGETLKEKIERAPLKLEEAVDITMNVAIGIARAHESKITHRDIKPSNILITEGGEVKILDFGLAKLIGSTKLTKDGTTLGTIDYMSPEQASGEEVDHRSDIWSLGVVLYEMITGRRPFKGEYEQAVIYSILNVEPEPVTALRIGVPLELERIIHKALTKSPGERFQHVDELLVDLKVISRELEQGRKGVKSTRARRPRVQRGYLLAGLLVLVALVVAGRFYLFTGRSEVIDSLAVLPLQNLSGDPDQEYFADGMTEALITELSRIKALRVISRTSALRYKDTDMSLPDIARELNVDAVVEGSVLRAGDQVRITAQLIKAEPEQHLWADDYERDLRDILNLHTEVARAIAKEIRIALTPEEETRLASTRSVIPEAHEAYLKGRFYINKWTKESVGRGIEYFEKAIEIDPYYALAHVGLARSYNLLASFDWISPKEGWPKAKAEVIRALEIDETLAEAHVILADVRFMYDWDWESAERDFKRAINLNPGYATAHSFYAGFLLSLGRHQEALKEMQIARELDPLSLSIKRLAVVIFTFSRQYDQAITQIDEILDSDPDHFEAHYWLGWAYKEQSMYDEAIEEFQKALTLSSEGSADSLRAVAGIARTYALSGETEKARELLDGLVQMSEQEFITPYIVAKVYLALGKKDQAFEWLEKAYQDRSPYLTTIKVDPEVDQLRADPRFHELLKKMRLEI